MKQRLLGILIAMFVFALIPSTSHARTYYSTNSEQVYIQYLQSVIEQLKDQLERIQGNRFNTHTNVWYGTNKSREVTYVVGRPRSGSNSNDDEPEIETDSARDIEDDSAELRGEVDMNDFNSGTVFFVYGEDENQVEDVEDDYDSYRDVDEDGDDLQKIRVDDDLDGRDTYERQVSGLDDNTDHFFQICVEYEDDDDDDVLACGGVEDFDTGRNSNNNDDEPDVTTDDAEEIEDDSAELHGEVDMNDFNNGLVFFVYGEDENQVEDIELDYDTYSDVDEDGDDLQKIKADPDLDGFSRYWWDIVRLDDATDYFFQICVEYEDEDGDDTIMCGGVEEFETDN